MMSYTDNCAIFESILVLLGHCFVLYRFADFAFGKSTKKLGLLLIFLQIGTCFLKTLIKEFVFN